jgi:UDPglucose--hexose-1-phosphate uridylyltransferase
MSESLPGGVVRTDMAMNDGRTIRYYDKVDKVDKGSNARIAVDKRPVEAPAGIGELRLDPLVNEWIAVASHRQHRSFLPPKELCPICPTTSDLRTEIPDSAFSVVVFDNKNPSLNAAPAGWVLPELNGPATATPAGVGKCEVVVFTDKHDSSLKELSEDQIALVVAAWRDRTKEISKLPNIVQIFPFENRGVEVGVTIPHPHGQIYAYSYLTPRTERMLAVAQSHRTKTGRVLMDDIVSREINDKVRIVAENAHWVAYVPFASRYPYEIHVAPKKRVPDFAELNDEQAAALPSITKEVLSRLDGVYGIPMPYMASWHQAPVAMGRDLLGLHLQITSVRRTPDKLKYLAGSESGVGAFVMDMAPEQSAEQLKAVKL